MLETPSTTRARVPSMIARAICLAALAALLSGCAGQSGLVYGYAQTARSGTMTRLGDYRTYATASCATMSLPQVTILKHPKHGRAEFGVGAARYAPGSPVAHPCDRGRGRATIVSYISDPGYRGPDAITYRVRFADGQTDIIVKELTVR